MPTLTFNDIRQARSDYFRDHNIWPSKIFVRLDVAKEIMEQGQMIAYTENDIKSGCFAKFGGMDWYERDQAAPFELMP